MERKMITLISDPGVARTNLKRGNFLVHLLAKEMTTYQYSVTVDLQQRREGSVDMMI